MLEGKFDLKDVEHSFVPFSGDYIKIVSSDHSPKKVLSFEPGEELTYYKNKITSISENFAVVDNSIIYFSANHTANIDFELNDEVECAVIDGVYRCGDMNYFHRCERMHKVEGDRELIKQIFGDSSDTLDERNVDSDDELAIGGQDMTLEALQSVQPHDKS